MNYATQTKKYKKYRISKQKFPTRILNNGTKGVLIIGHVNAKKHLEGVLGRSIDHFKDMHSPNEWIWGELLTKGEK